MMAPWWVLFSYTFKSAILESVKIWSLKNQNFLKSVGMIPQKVISPKIWKRHFWKCYSKKVLKWKVQEQVPRPIDMYFTFICCRFSSHFTTFISFFGNNLTSFTYILFIICILNHYNCISLESRHFIVNKIRFHFIIFV